MFSVSCATLFGAIALLSLELVRVDALYMEAAGVCVQTPQGCAPQPHVAQREVYNPRILDPTAHTVWKVGDVVTVTWDTSQIPSDSSNTGRILLGYTDQADSSNEHLDLANPLAADFNLTDGHVKVTVPAVKPRGGYIVVLMGDSGNKSPPFKIDA